MKPNYTYNAKVLKVLDGDTIDVEVELWKDLKYKVRLRLAHINAPEVHTEDFTEKGKGIRATEALENLLDFPGVPESAHDGVTIKILAQEKYGRFLAEVYYPIAGQPQGKYVYVNDWMVEHKHAKPYEGGKREAYPENPFQPLVDMLDYAIDGDDSDAE